jgi:taurine dioxygenase
MGYEFLAVEPLAGALGAKIHGADLTDLRNEKMWVELLKAFHEFKAIAIQGQTLSPENLMQVGGMFGQPCAYPFAEGIEGFDFITDVIKGEADHKNFGGDWHIDSMYLDAPPLATLLYAIETPPYGGDTLFADTARAYDALSVGMQDLLKGLVGISSGTLKYRKGGARQAYLSNFSSMDVQNAKMGDAFEARHPIVRTHPVTGRKSLYVSPIHTIRFDGLTEDESRPIIDYICSHLITPEFSCRIGWAEGQLTIWDNRTTLHCAINDYNGQRRHMRRLTVGPEMPV